MSSARKRYARVLRLFHLSPRRNRRSLMCHGIKPNKSQGRVKRVWLCDRTKLRWAIRHVSRHHGTTPSAMDVYVVYAFQRTLTLIRHGIYTCNVVLMAFCPFAADDSDRFV